MLLSIFNKKTPQYDFGGVGVGGGGGGCLCYFTMYLRKVNNVILEQTKVQV